MPEPVRYILIGAHGYSTPWVKLILPKLIESQVAVPAAVVDDSAERLKAAQMYLGVPPQYCYQNPQEALEMRHADFVIIATPTFAHEKLLELAMTFDIHAMVEAPLTDTMDSALRLYGHAKKQKKIIAVASPQRYEQDKQTVMRIVQSHRFGRLNYLVCRFTDNNRRSPAWGRTRHEMDNPLLIEAASQQLDVFRAITDSNARTVYAVSWNPPWGEYRGDSTAFVTMEMENGVHCLYEGAKANASTLNGWDDEYLRAECEHATIELEHRQIRIVRNAALEQPKYELAPLDERPSWGNQWLVEMFCAALRGEGEMPNTLKDHVRCLTMIFAAAESAKLGRPIDVRTFLRQYGSASEQSNEDQRA